MLILKTIDRRSEVEKINPDDVRLTVEASEEEQARGILVKHIRLSDLPEEVQENCIKGLQEMIEEYKQNKNILE